MRAVKSIIYLFAGILSLHLCSWAVAQDRNLSLPELKDDGIYKSGILANGINYYFVSNPSGKGLISLSLVQKMDPSVSEEELSASAEGYIAQVKTVAPSFQSFLSRNGIYPSRKGYIGVTKGSVQFNVENLSSAMPENVIDSTLLAVFELASIMAREGGNSASQALMMSGDFDQKTMLGKMRLLSLIAPAVKGPVPESDYKWDSLRTANNRLIVKSDNGTAIVRALWNDARTPEEYMKTVLPVISDKMAGEFGWLLTHNLDLIFQNERIKAWSEFTHTNSASGPYDEQLQFTVNCLASDTDRVSAIVKKEFTRLLSTGIGEMEYSYVEDSYKYAWLAKARNPIVSNEELLMNCRASFLYGAPMANEAEKMKFAYRDMSDEVKTSLFNSYMAKLLAQLVEKDENATEASLMTSRTTIDNSVRSYLSPSALKAPKGKSEYISGGTMWTFSNGVNVIYKKLKTNGYTHFSYICKGGREYADEDNFKTISGIHEYSFENYLAANGIRLRTELHPADVRISGDVVDGNWQKMMGVLIAMSAKKENAKVFGPDNYKVLVLVSDMDEESVRLELCKTIAGLGNGGKWTPTRFVEENENEEIDLRGFIYRDMMFSLDKSAGNEALADVASYALMAALAREFDGCGVFPSCWHSFYEYPVGDFRLVLGVHPVPAGTYNLETRIPGEKEIQYRLTKVLKNLAASELDKNILAEYKQRAKNARTSISNTPEYIIRMVVERYAENKDMTRYLSRVDAITAQQIQSFYASAVTSNR